MSSLRWASAAARRPAGARARRSSGSAAASNSLRQFRMVIPDRPRSAPTVSDDCPGSRDRRTASARNSAEYLDLFPTGHLLTDANNSVSVKSGQAHRPLATVRASIAMPRRVLAPDAPCGVGRLVGDVPEFERV